MSVQALEAQVRALSPEELAQFSQWFEAYRETTLGDDGDEEEGDLSEDQRREILRRRAAYLADPSSATPWEGTAERLIHELRARRGQKAAAR